jgi:hypothetical protein
MPSRLACIAALLLAGGCAPQPYTHADLDGRVVCDSDRMDQVERTARRDNTHVEWVNCPTARLRVQ